MDSDLTPEQRAQIENRDASGKFKHKAHGDVDDTADVLGLGSSGPGQKDAYKEAYCASLSQVHSQAPGSAAAALESESALVRLSARSGWDLDPRRAAARTPPETRVEAAICA